MYLTSPYLTGTVWLPTYPIPYPPFFPNYFHSHTPSSSGTISTPSFIHSHTVTHSLSHPSSPSSSLCLLHCTLSSPARTLGHVRLGDLSLFPQSPTYYIFPFLSLSPPSGTLPLPPPYIPNRCVIRLVPVRAPKQLALLRQRTNQDRDRFWASLLVPSQPIPSHPDPDSDPVLCPVCVHVSPSHVALFSLLAAPVHTHSLSADTTITATNTSYSLSPEVAHAGLVLSLESASPHPLHLTHTGTPLYLPWAVGFVPYRSPSWVALT